MELTPEQETVAKAIADRVLEIIAQRPRVLPEYLTIDEASELTGFNRVTLRNYRARGIGPPYVKLDRKVLYPVADLRAYVEAGRSW